MNEFINYRFDNDFDRLIADKTLRWRPWVGKDFALSNPLRLLLVLESHYCKNSEALLESQGPEYTRDILELEPENNLTYGRIHKLFLHSMDVNEQQLWSKIVFYNFVQEPMDWREGRRSPTREQFRASWRSFPGVVELLKPTHCIFLGVSAFGELRNAAPGGEYRFESVNEHQIPGVGTARTTSIAIHGQPLPIVAVWHPASWKRDEWGTIYREFLRSQCPGLLDTFLTK